MRHPFLALFLLITALHYWDVPGWVWGVFGVVYSVILLGWMYDVATRDELDVFSNRKENK